MYQMGKFVFKILFFIIFTLSIFKSSFACPQGCEDKGVDRKINPDIPNPCSDQFEIITDFTYGDCEDGYFYAENENCFYNCFPRCLIDCGEVACYPNKCPPGHICPNDESGGDELCQVDENSCFKYHYGKVVPNLRPDGWKPNCLPDGTWAPKQCKGESHNGRCFCYDAVGNRIFGQEFMQKADNMTCACSRKRAELMKSESRFYTSLHCDSMGNYEPLQCDNGQCWCVETMTGEITANVVPEKMMKLLPCYSTKDVGEQYMRQCESEEYAQKKILHEMKTHGTQYANFKHIMCDADGTYGVYHIDNGQAYCKWKDNTNIQSFMLSLTDPNSNIDELNCNCARDKKIYELAGKLHTLSCTLFGNYNPKQLTDGMRYCVDNDGFRISDYCEILKDDCSCG